MGDGAREEGEAGTEEARRECRMYLAESRSISCCRSGAAWAGYSGMGIGELTLGFELLVLDLLQNVRDFVWKIVDAWVDTRR